MAPSKGGKIRTGKIKQPIRLNVIGLRRLLPPVFGRTLSKDSDSSYGKLRV